ncbi:hypothetical protein NC661_02045 [Aquibacillus koreensis]|uniref:Tfp pilus assembly protein PilN n=1 Tax=Aquibacillus koreensis TaxID=279446 RepID=A0A9X3WIK3_9BACI|nr:hypothetical protein [Aquibacillus koreensis]MCT2537949.1 hypothetical protein [Aquibacillus koreensis]MDC3419160.1 hypothetical protein [Aquibacillus koreensis]
MVEINFLETKKRNLTPYILALLFLLLLLGAAFILYWQMVNYEEQVAILEEKRDANIALQTEIRSVEALQAQRNTLKNQVDQLETTRYPTLSLLDQMIGLLPDNVYFESYTFSIQDGLYLDIRVDDVEQVAAYSFALESEDFVNHVEISQITNQDATSYIASMYVEMDEQVLLEVAQTNDN